MDMEGAQGGNQVPHSPRAEGLLPQDPVRRRLIWGGLGVAAAAYAGAFVYPIYRYLADPAEKAAELAKVTEVEIPEADLPAPGSAIIFKFGSRKALLIRHADGEYVCLGATCTHLGCTVAYQAEQDRIYCACHGGVYDSRTGRNVSGPPPRPLDTFGVERVDGKVIVRRT